MRPSRQARITPQFEQRSAWWIGPMSRRRSRPGSCAVASRSPSPGSSSCRCRTPRNRGSWISAVAPARPRERDGAGELASEDRSAMQRGCVTLKPGGSFPLDKSASGGNECEAARTARNGMTARKWIEQVALHQRRPVTTSSDPFLLWEPGMSLVVLCVASRLRSGQRLAVGRLSCCLDELETFE